MGLKAPFPYFGGKSIVAAKIWRVLGDVDNYLEPFGGSLAVLLARPQDHHRRWETVNDADGFIVNFWRAVQRDPEMVAKFADAPVFEADLTAKHVWLIDQGQRRLKRLEADPDFYDAQVAGWWVWGMCLWIGGSWCSGEGGYSVGTDGKLHRAGRKGANVIKRVPEGTCRKGLLAGTVPCQRPYLTTGQGSMRKRPHLSARQGVMRKGLHHDMGHGTSLRGLVGREVGRIPEYLCDLAERLHGVDVLYGDWARTVKPVLIGRGKAVGVFLDPPYSLEYRSGDLYRTDKAGIAEAVRAWCLAHGDDPRLRIVLCGLEYEHRDQMPANWRMITWKGRGGYRQIKANSTPSVTAGYERLWLSPACLSLEAGAAQAD